MQKAIVIGATSGIGRGIARELAKHQYKVVITGRRKNLLEELYAENPDAYIIKTLDVTHTANTVAVLNDAVKELGGLDLLVLSSGIAINNEDLDFTFEKITMDICVQGFTCLADWGFNFFRRQGHGHLTAITSFAGIRGWRKNPCYNASKAYQINYLEGLRNLANHIKLPVTVTDIRAGYVKTDLMGDSYVFWVTSVEKAAGQIYTDIKKKKSVSYVTRRWRLIAWLYRNFPQKLIEMA